MKITKVTTTLLTGPSTEDPFLREARGLRSAAFVEITTDRGLVGVGETYAGYFCPELIPPTVAAFAPILVGQTLDPDRDLSTIDDLWRRMYLCENYWCRVGLGPAVITAIECALWDLAGKALRKPVHALLASPRHHASLSCYATGGPSNYPKDRLAAKADFYLSLGFRGFKIGTGSYDRDKGWFAPSGRDATVEFEADKVRFLREHCGRDVKILMDGHMGNSPTGVWDLDTATAVLKAMEPFDLFFFEEPLPYTDPFGYATLAERTTTRVAGGECLTAPCEWLPYVTADSFNVAQPDASWVGGMRPFLDIAKQFELRGKQIATHAWGAGGSLMQNIHAGFAAPNTCILEIPPAFGPLHREVIGDSFVLRDGVVLPPQSPGMGVTLSDDVKRRFPFVPGSGEFIPVPGKTLINTRPDNR